MAGSWECMLAFQPPVTRVHLRAFVRFYPDNPSKLGWEEVWHPDGKINSAAGLTLGNVAMLVRRRFERHKGISNQMLKEGRHGGRHVV